MNIPEYLQGPPQPQSGRTTDSRTGTDLYPSQSQEDWKGRNQRWTSLPLDRLARATSDPGEEQSGGTSELIVCDNLCPM